MGAPGAFGKGGETKGKSKGKNKTFVATASTPAPAANADGLCKFFGSAKGCSTEGPCPFSHSDPNSVAPCSFKQRLGYCEKAEACTFRHQPWASVEQAKAHYAARDRGAVTDSTKVWKQLHRDHSAGSSPGKMKMGKEHVEMPLEEEAEKDIQEEMYGSVAMRMMEKMGYKAGSGLGKQETGRTKLVDPCLALEHASQSASLGFGNFDPATIAKPAERAAKMADARKRARVGEKGFVVHTLLSDDESSDGEDKHTTVKDLQL